MKGEIAGAAAAAPRRIVGCSTGGPCFREMLAPWNGPSRGSAELSMLATPETIVCRCEDVRLGALDRAVVGPAGKAVHAMLAWAPARVNLRRGTGMRDGVVRRFHSMPHAAIACGDLVDALTQIDVTPSTGAP